MLTYAMRVLTYACGQELTRHAISMNRFWEAYRPPRLQKVHLSTDVRSSGEEAQKGLLLGPSTFSPTPWA